MAMSEVKPYGLYVYRKDAKDLHVLKDLLQLMKVSSPRKGAFMYVEDQNGLFPHLSLQENLQLVSAFDNWKDFLSQVNPEYHSWINLIRKPQILASEAQGWERILIGLLKSSLIPTEHLLINICEEELSPFMIGTFKKIFLEQASTKNVYLATNTPSLWLDCAHSLVHRNGYKFEVKRFDETLIRKHWSAA